MAESLRRGFLRLAVSLVMSEQRTHVLKTWPSQFQAVLDGRKTHEWRKNGRDFAVGDRLVLREYDPDAQIKLSGRSIDADVTWLTEGFGVPAGWCCMSIKIVTPRDLVGGRQEN